MLGSNQRSLPCEGSTIVCWGFLELAKLPHIAAFFRRRFSQHFRRFTRVAAQLLHKANRLEVSRYTVRGEAASITISGSRMEAFLPTSAVRHDGREGQPEAAVRSAEPCTHSYRYIILYRNRCVASLSTTGGDTSFTGGRR